MRIQETIISNDKQRPVYLYELSNNTGTTVKITNIGATITSITTPDKNGKIEEVTLGFDDPMTYLSDNYKSNCPYLGTTAGRFANRIAKGQFTLSGKTYQLAINNGENHLHGGPEGFHFKLWKGEIMDNKLVMKLSSPDNDEGYPGNLEVSITYQLTDDHELIMEYYAETDQATPVNLTNHAYFNLSGQSGDILNHEVMIMADQYTPAIDAIPTGELASVKDTPFDFTSLHTIGERIDSLPEKTYDHNFVLKHKEGELERAASLRKRRLAEYWKYLPPCRACNFMPDTF
ncbi:aldose epimerase family protein [Geofilum rubicundum]|uniref:Aldose 1-epimerase n=1 Tax=Geofilum rubicundum JCM 15548 TaxID=1236989 RepID=A0A0E9LRC4_9BACT|nr:aldose epimerase family protein [Geofilum rubicundum]GAO27853.1 aldose 1-epimerase [Geofilum rubicundum JCM 15548]